MGTKPKNEYTAKEAQERFEAALRGAMNTPHKPHLGKPAAASAKKKPAKKPAKKAC